MAWHRRSFDDKERIEEVGRLVLDAVRRRKRRQRLDAEEDDRDEGDGSDRRLPSRPQTRVMVTESKATMKPALDVSGYSNGLRTVKLQRPIIIIIMFYCAIMAARHTVQYTHIQSYAQINPLKHKKIFLNS